MNTAEQLAQKQKDISVAEFFERNRHLLGFDNKRKALLTVVKEAVDNSLDACEEAKILPDINVEIIDMGQDRYKVIIEDNGPGIIKKNIPNVFAKLLYGSKFHRMRQSLTEDEPIIFLQNEKVHIESIQSLIDPIIGNDEVKDVTNLNILAPAFDKNTRTYSWKKVSHVIKHKRENEIIKIKTKTGRTIKVTGCHSLFTYNNETEKIEEIEARTLKEGSYIIAPATIPTPKITSEINILEYITYEDVKKMWIYIYGIDKKFIENIFSSAKIIHKKTSKSRKFYRFETPEGKIIDVLDDSFKQYITKEFLPLHLVINLGMVNMVKNGIIQTYYHGTPSRIPITWQITPALMRFLGLFVAEGHTDVRQAGFTFGLHEDHFVDEITRTARILGSNVTVEKRERSYRVKVFGGIISILLRKWCGKGAKEKRIPEFVFRSNKNLRQEFIDAYYQGDGHQVKKRNCLMAATASKKLANDILYLWLLQGVLATIRKATFRGLGKEESTTYRINVYGKDVQTSNIFKTGQNIRWKQSYKKIPIENSNGTSGILIQEQHLCLLEVTSIETINEGYTHVYDLSVPECENFIGGTGGIACHNSRGQQGIGISAAVLYSQLTTGRPAKITSKTGIKEATHYYELHIDTQKNNPQIIKDEIIEWKDKTSGVKVELDIEAIYQKGEQSVDAYLRETAITNPHANITYTTPRAEQFIFQRASNNLPREPQEIKPHPYGVEHGIMQKMIRNTQSRTMQQFLTSEFSRVSPSVAKEILEKSAIPPNMKPPEITHAHIEAIMNAVKNTKIMAPPTDCIVPIGAELLEKGLRKEVNAEFYTSVTRTPEVYRGIPFVVECAIAFGGEQPKEETARLLRYANRVPLLYQQGSCASFKAAIQTNWKQYGIPQTRGALPQGPITIVVHLASVWPPFTSEAKEAVAHYPEIIKEMKLALQEVARRLALYVRKKARVGAEGKKRSYIETYLPHVANSLKNLLGISQKEEAVIKTTLGELLEKKRGEIEKFEVKNEEYDEDLARIGKKEGEEDD